MARRKSGRQSLTATPRNKGTVGQEASSSRLEEEEERPILESIVVRLRDDVSKVPSLTSDQTSHRYSTPATPCPIGGQDSRQTSTSSTEGDLRRLEVERRLDSTWGSGQWSPPPSFNRSKRSLGAKSRASLLEVGIAARDKGIEPATLYQEGGAIYRVAVDRAASTSSPTRWLSSITPDVLDLIEAMPVPSKIAGPEANMGGVMSSRALFSKARTSASRSTLNPRASMPPEFSSDLDSPLPPPPSTLPARPQASPSPATSVQYALPPVPRGSSKKNSRKDDTATSEHGRSSAPPSTGHPDTHSRIPGLGQMTPQPEDEPVSADQSGDVDEIVKRVGKGSPLTLPDVRTLQHVGPFTSSDNVSVLPPINMADQSIDSIGAGQRPTVTKPHGFFVMIHHASKDWTLVHLQERLADSEIRVHHYDSDDDHPSRYTAVGEKLKPWILTNFDHLEQRWESKVSPGEATPSKDSSGVIALLTLYVLRGNYKLPKGKWPGPTIRSYLVEAIDTPDPWMAQVKDYYEEETLREEEADESFVPAGSDSGIDMSRGVSQTSREDEEASANKEVHGTKRVRESSKSSIGEATGEPPRKKQCDLSRFEVANTLQTKFSDMLLYLSQSKQALEDQSASAEKALEEANLGLTESEKKRAEQEKAYLEKKKTHDEAKTILEDLRHSIRWMEQKGGLKGTKKLISQGRLQEEELAAEAEITALAEGEEKARKEGAEEETKKASDELEKRKKSCAYAEATLDGIAKQASALEAFHQAELNSSLIQDWLK